ncbi:MAG: hypothetical protein Q8P30_02300 [Candidatus Uhrbacteria bacterium]|nr:hypothetical protein [Candidatus Uhrbacteria bacterium]
MESLQQEKKYSLSSIISRNPNELIFTLVVIFIISIFALGSVIVGGIMQSQISDIERIVLTVPPEGRGTVLIDNEEGEIVHYSGSSNIPSFDYLLGWHIASTNALDYLDSEYVMFVNADPINICEGCDGPGASIVISAFYRPDTDNNGDDFISDRLESYKQEYYSEVLSSTTSFANGEKTKVSGHIETGLAGPADFEEVYFEGEDYIVLVLFSDNDSTEADNVAWNLIQGSLDFETVE